MKKISLFWLILPLLSACQGWDYAVPTFPAPPPTLTPAIFTPTPFLLTATSQSPETATLPVVASPTLTGTQSPTETETSPTETPSLPAEPAGMNLQILGCNTSLDLTHGMGEVTNAFVRLINTSGSDQMNTCVTLFALDEGRTHPDKTVCISRIPDGHQVEFKLTVDSTYNQDTPIQVELASGDQLMSRIGSPVCEDIGIFAPNPDSLLTPVPLP